MSDPAPSSSTWVTFSIATHGTVTYSQVTAGGIGGGGGITVSNFDPNLSAITDTEDKG